MTESIYDKFWVDHSGMKRKTPTCKQKYLNFYASPLYHRLLEFIYIRDNFACQWCFLQPIDNNITIDGTTRIMVPSYVGRNDAINWLVLDYLIPIKDGGTHHPSNIRTMCEWCKFRKDNTIGYPNIIFSVG